MKLVHKVMELLVLTGYLTNHKEGRPRCELHCGWHGLPDTDMLLLYV
jgi:hypothetical protein